MAAQKKSRANEVSEEIFFMNIVDPKDIRKALLETSQQIVEGMKSYEKYKKIKAEKLKKIEVLKAMTLQIRENVGKLRACLPTVKGLPEKIKEEKLPHITQIELEQLNAEIAKLEEELKLVK